MPTSLSTQEVVAPLTPPLLSHLSEPGGRRAVLARAVDLRAVDGGDEALEPELAVDDLGLVRDRRLAVAVETLSAYT